jgi:hydrogenase/urease accessory protein HupE
MKGSLWARLVLGLLLFSFPFGMARAHPTLFTATQVCIKPDGSYRFFLRFDLLAFVLGKTSLEIADPPMNRLLDGPPQALEQKLAEAQKSFFQNFAIQTDRGPGKIERIKFPNLADIDHWKASGITPRLPVIGEIELEGHLPPDATDVALRFPAVLGSVVITVDKPGEEPYDEPVDPGTYSSQVPIHLHGSAVGATGRSGNTLGWSQVFGRYISLGIRHIIPEGLDHIFFVLGLFLLGTRLSNLLWQVTAFTAAHSITLSLALYGVVRLSPHIVEPLIALSIAYVGIENLVTDKLSPWRPLVVFGFGLIHGLGFASAIQETGLPRKDFLSALVGFNIGVELGQLTVIALAFLAVGWFRHLPRYRKIVVIPGSALIALVAVVWFFQRIFV